MRPFARSVGGGSQDCHALVSTWMPPVMHSAMQAPPRYVLKTSLLKRITPTAALLIWRHGQVWFSAVKHQNLSSSSFVRRRPAGVLSGQRDGQLPQPTNIKHPGTSCSLANHGPAPSTTTTLNETTTVSPDGWGGRETGNTGQVGSPDRKQEVM